MILTQNDIAALMLSLQVSAVAALVFGLPCVLVGVWLGSGHSPLRSILQGILTVPLVMPPVVTGLLLLKLFLLIYRPLVFTWWAAAIASGCVAAPLLIRTVAAGVASADPRLVTVARSLGASKLRALITVTLPLCWHAIVGGGVLFWARAMGEFGAVMVVAGNTPGLTQTMPLAIYSKLESSRGESIWPLVCISVAASLAAVLISELLVRRSAGRFVGGRLSAGQARRTN